VKFEQSDETIRAAQAAARRLLVRAIDLRFDLDDTADAARTGHGAAGINLLQLRADSDAVRVEIDRLAQLLLPVSDGSGPEPEDVEEATAVAHA